jgi:hypothetical protein
VLLTTLWFRFTGSQALPKMVYSICFQTTEDDGEGLHKKLFLKVALEYLVVPGSRAHKHHSRWSTVSVSRLPKIVSRSSLQCLCLSFTLTGKGVLKAQRGLKFPCGPAVAFRSRCGYVRHVAIYFTCFRLLSAAAHSTALK